MTGSVHSRVASDGGHWSQSYEIDCLIPKSKSLARREAMGAAQSINWGAR